MTYELKVLFQDDQDSLLPHRRLQGNGMQSRSRWRSGPQWDGPAHYLKSPFHGLTNSPRTSWWWAACGQEHPHHSAFPEDLCAGLPHHPRLFPITYKDWQSRGHLGRSGPGPAGGEGQRLSGAVPAHRGGLPIVFSVTDKTTFEHVDCFHQLILRVKDRESFPMILLVKRSIWCIWGKSPGSKEKKWRPSTIFHTYKPVPRTHLSMLMKPSMTWLE